MALADNEVQVGAQGRVVIPAALRKALKLTPGQAEIAVRFFSLRATNMAFRWLTVLAWHWRWSRGCLC